MALEHVNTILKEAEAGRYGVMCFECVNYEQIRWCIEAAEEEQSDVILMLYYDMTFYISAAEFIAIAKRMAESASVRVGLSYVYADTLELVHQALEAGFPSVCFHPGEETQEERIACTRQAAMLAHEYGADIAAVPGEYGQLTAAQAADFAAQTGIDALVAPVVYGHENNNTNFTPVRHWYDTNVDLVDEAMLRELRSLTQLPLILHRANNLSVEEKHKAIRLGTSKFDNGCPLDTQLYRAARRIMESTDCGESFFAFLMELRQPSVKYIAGCIRELKTK